MKIFLLCALALFVSCDRGPKKRSSNQLNVALASKVATLDPAISYDTVSAKVVYQIFEPLFEYEYLIRPYTLKPLVAEELPLVTDNGMTYTIKIKKNVLFHAHEAFEGGQRTVTAQDFVNSIKRI